MTQHHLSEPQNFCENFSGRVAYAAATIAAGRPTSRTFDNCFENSDGDEVATIIYRCSIRNPKIAAKETLK